MPERSTSVSKMMPRSAPATPGGAQRELFGEQNAGCKLPRSQAGQSIPCCGGLLRWLSARCSRARTRLLDGLHCGSHGSSIFGVGDVVGEGAVWLQELAARHVSTQRGQHLQKGAVEKWNPGAG